MPAYLSTTCRPRASRWFLQMTAAGTYRSRYTMHAYKVVLCQLVGRHRIMGAVSEETTLATTVLKVTIRSRPVHRSRQRQGVNSRVGRQRR
jgi:hypothetical protein